MNISNHLKAHGERCLATQPGTLKFEIMLPLEEADTIMLYEVYASPGGLSGSLDRPINEAGRPGRFWSSAQYERDPLQRRGVKFQRSVADATDQNDRFRPVEQILLPLALFVRDGLEETGTVPANFQDLPSVGMDFDFREVCGVHRLRVRLSRSIDSQPSSRLRRCFAWPSRVITPSMLAWRKWQ